MAVTEYRWDDGSAPQINSVDRDNVIDVLTACLVTGYGAKLAAGWTKEFEDLANNKVAYKQGGTGHLKYNYFRLDQYHDNYGQCRGYENMTSIDVGTGIFPTTGQDTNHYLAHYPLAATTTKWIILADERTVHMFFEYALYAGVRGWFNYSFGDIIPRSSADLGQCMIAMSPNSSTECILGCTPDSNSTSYAKYLNNDYDGISGSYPVRGVGSIVGNIRATGVDSYYSGANGLPYPDALTGGAILSPILLFNQTTGTDFRGSIRGLWQICHAKPFTNLDTFSGTGDLAGRTFRAIDIVARTTGTVYDGQIAVEISDTW